MLDLRRVTFALAVGTSLLPAPAGARLARQFRAVWVDTFNTSLNTHGDIRRVVDSVRAAHANVILAQVRRRGDAWYLDSPEPPPDFTPIDRGFDPLADLLGTAHSHGLQVHAFVIVGAIWNKDPALPAPGNGMPQDSRHVFRRHSGFDAERRVIVPGSDNWLTRTLVSDGSGVSYQGHRFGNDFWLDFGHPDAAAHTVEVLAHLVRRYDVDGLHLDRIRYPEFSAPGQTPTAGASVGYNAVSLARFMRHYRLPSNSAPPAPGDLRWSNWRREQVSNLVRRIYLTTAAIKPELPVSAALIAFGGAPTSDATWQSAEAYWRVHQDWRAWLEEGILDIAIPMIYRREHDLAQARQFDDWRAWIVDRANGRCSVAGIGAFLNGVEGTLRQARRSAGAGCGLALFSLATASEALIVNPWSRPPGQPTPRRSFDELASALVSGRSLDGRVFYDDPAVVPVFADEALPPVLPWKLRPLTGHLMGIARSAEHGVFDTATVYIINSRADTMRVTRTDGNGFFGVVDLPPDRYRISVITRGTRLVGDVAVTPGVVADVRLRDAR